MEYVLDICGSFGGLVYETIAIENADILIQGIPYEGSISSMKGTSKAPSALRATSKNMQTITRYGLDLNDIAIKDLGDIPVKQIDGTKTREIIEKFFVEILEKSEAIVITLGGDHSLTYPLLKGLSKDGTRVGVIWFDAHRDLLDELMGSKFSHGCSLRRSIELEGIKAHNVLMVGTRYNTTEEEEIVEKMNIKEMRMVDIEKKGFEKILEDFRKIIINISKGVDEIYVSIDIDVLDPAFAPGTGTPVAGGLSTSQLMRFIKSIPVKVRAFDIMEVSPPLDHTTMTLKATMGLITEIIGQIKENQSII